MLMVIGVKTRIKNRTISIEREFRVNGWNAKEFIEKIKPKIKKTLKKKRIKEKVILKEEVGLDSGEFVIAFSDLERLKKIYPIISEIFKETTLISDPYKPEKINEFFTTILYPHTKKFAGLNAIHIHINMENEKEMFKVYKNLNSIAPKILALSSTGKRHKILHQIYSNMENELWIPQEISSLGEFERLKKEIVEKINFYLKENRTIKNKLIIKYPQFFYRGRLKKITPDKIFHYARVRPDLNGIGTVEFRAIDGQKNHLRDLAFIYISLGHAFERKDFDPEKIKYELNAVNEKGINAFNKKDLINLIEEGLENIKHFINKKIKKEINKIMKKIRG